jgi:hypothetical protein
MCEEVNAWGARLFDERLHLGEGEGRPRQIHQLCEQALQSVRGFNPISRPRRQ